ncbi:GHMP family kinase ATP-binding protein [Azospirillum rugosum]|uniref:D-glycero-alpha-D-manno-heptose-7-phosphate kinase n=1 Tax=Azospirillum rugosum TaxID=416170 RepID=A0ABS4SNV8_9PROT|nr:hypothetical protein [Azospirillum rugosum]MBP2294251.1 D-glycero-alpha-D-manno-heptose-7-phosphate kinase [Azospirillum rugosum]MDQ0527586.1 D-glycero-alpha-D-manno-heptose-7-phosphate kinase [Azospirillum rugosum]
MKHLSDSVIRSRAPLRLGFAGGGTEISPYVDRFGGVVLNATLGLHALTSIQPSPDGRIHFHAKDMEQSMSFDLADELPTDNALQLHCAVYNRMIQSFGDGRALPITVTTHCDAPPGSGLGSSSTLTVAMISAYDRLLRASLDEYSIARVAFEIERISLGLQGGHQDQYAASFGGFNLIEFLPDGEVVVNSLKIAPRIIRELESSLVLYYTGRSRSSGDIIANQAKNLAEPSSEAVESMHRIKEMVGDMRQCLVAGDIARLGRLLHQSWEAKKRTASSVSNSHIDDLYEAVLKAGAIGGKISGAGGGGFMMLVVDPVRRLDVIRSLSRDGGFVLPTSFVQEGVQSWHVPQTDTAFNRRRALIPA